MGYGITATASGGQFQIDSSLSSTQHLSVYEKGSVLAGGTKIIDFGDVVFARASGSNGPLQVNTNRVVTSGYAIGRIYTFRYAADYVITKPISLTTFATSIATTDYGIQVKNQSGAVCFDSRALNFGLEIIQVHARNSLYGGHPQITGYSAANNVVFSNSFSSRNIYVSVFGSENNYSNVTNGILVSGYVYNSSNGTIHHEGFVSWPPVPGFYSGQVPILNPSEILVGELFE